jgi:hypothetical protein
MALSKLVFKPGVNRDQTNYASEGGWFETQLVRFRSGYPEKFGGWTVSNLNPYTDSARAIFSWSTTDGSNLLGIGTNSRVYVGAGTTLYDITPIYATYTTSTIPDTDNCISTTNGSKTVTVTLTGNGATTGTYVTLSGITGSGSPAAIGGIPVSEMNTTVQVTELDSNTFTFEATTTATSTTTGQGGTGITVVIYMPAGFSIATAGYGWGTSTWSRLTWGSGSTSPIFQPARLIFMDKFNNDLVFNTQYDTVSGTGGEIYYWSYNTAFSNDAVLLKSLAGAVAVPQKVTKILFTPQGFLLALGCTNYDALAPSPDYLGTYDPLLIRWSNVDPDIGPEPENWQPTVTNTAGFLRLQSGSRIVTAINTRQETLVFTNTSLTSIQFLGTAEVFGLQELSHNISIIGPNALVGSNNITYWMGRDRFYTYSGRVDTLPCTIRQYIFTDLNYTQSSLIFAGVNNKFTEIIWFYPSANSDEIDRYVVFNYLENIWYYGQLERTAWIDSGVFNNPVALKNDVHGNGWVYQHENGTDDGQPLGAAPLPITAFIQSADVDIDDGDKYMLIRRVIPDINFRGSSTSNEVTGAPIIPEADITVGVRNFPGAASSITNAEGQTTDATIVTATATVDQYTNQVFIRARGRQMNFKIGSDTVGTQWQLGLPRVDARPDGTRN